MKASDKSTQDALRRIATEEIDAGLAELDDPGIDLHEKVHQLRKRAKKLRGLIRLYRPAFPDFEAENAVIRDAARRLSALRDREGMVETYDKLVAATGATEFAPVRDHLVANRDAAAAKAHVEDDLAAFREEFETLRQRAAHWKLKTKGFAAIRAGLEKTFGRARKARQAAADVPDELSIHEWRKRVKYHWYHTRLLSPLKDDILSRRATQTRDLSELLGDHHDLSVLDDFIAASGDLPGDPALWAAFRTRIADRQKVLEDEAQSLGTRLFASSPKDLGKRWAGWWRDWRSA
ncbi:CHAD domain-containing protein [Rhodovulum sp. P5]|uniref:CHAD domain-containing protein n=1 Tax=Rhodovulum sp. P5 TaxID=1564506 RepID=UPI0015605618|nr:CHAD domain-containing protein [Rhodovulum sp. P5]